MTMTPELKQIEPFIPVPRYITADVANGKLTYGEYELYIWMRLHANVYGIAQQVSAAGLLKDLPHYKSEDNISKFLRSLRSKKYVNYPRRQGHRGSFEVRFYDWLYDKQQTRPSGRHLDEEELRSSEVAVSAGASEVGRSSVPQTPKLEGQFGQDFTHQDKSSDNSKLRSHNNDTDTQSYNKQNESSKPIKRVVAFSYQPNNDAERRCKQIALAVGDHHINFILSVLNDRDGGIEVIEEGYEQFCEAKRKYEDEGKPVSNPPALFNRCIMAIVESNRYERETKEDR